MSFELKLALKYFRARRKSLARFTSMVAVLGIAAGVASLILAQALARGFADEMRDKILSNTAHVSVFLKDGTEIPNWPDIKTKLEKEENVSEVSPTAFESAVIIGETETSYAVLRVPNSGFQGQSQSNLEPGTVAIGAKLAEKLNLKPGDSAEILTIGHQTPSRVRVAATFQTGLYEYDSTWIYLAPEHFARLRGQTSFTPSVLNVSVKDIYQAAATGQNMREILGEQFRVVDWQEANRPLFAALSLERKVALSIISLIIFIAALNITTTLALLVNERRSDIAILRTCGAKARSLVLIFLLEGLLLGFFGIFFGVAAGLLGCFLGNHLQIISLSAEVYSLGHIPFHPQITGVLLIISITFAICLAATVFPALKASRIKPLENLRAQ